MKTCNACKVEKDYSEFHKNKKSKDGFQERCKSCRAIYRKQYYEKNKDREYELKKIWRTTDKARAWRREWDKKFKKENAGYYSALNNERRARKLQRTVKWGSPDKIREIYEEAAEMRKQGQNVHVDHIIPLQGENVSGLHVENNLQIITAEENLRKSNKFVDEYQ